MEEEEEEEEEKQREDEEVGSYAGDLYASEESDEDNLAYYLAPKGKVGRHLVPGGPERPCVDGYSKEDADMMLHAWRVSRKKVH